VSTDVSINFSEVQKELFVEVINEVTPEFGLIEQEDRNLVIETVKNYASPGCGNLICWLAYRIWNCIKAIFGQSDWQKTAGMFQSQMVSHFVRTLERRVVDKSRFQSFSNSLKGDIQECASKIAPRFLSFFLEAFNLLKDADTPDLSTEAERLANDAMARLTDECTPFNNAFQQAVANKSQAQGIQLNELDEEAESNGEELRNPSEIELSGSRER